MGRSTQDHVFTIKQVVEKTVLQGRQAFFAFVDLEKAFDRVPRSMIWESLQRRGIDEKMLKVVRSLYKKSTNY